MNDKVSKYNIEVEHTDCILFYNTLTNKLLPISYKDYAVIETLMEHLRDFSNRFPVLYDAFKRSGFIINSDFDELAFIRLKNKRIVYVHNNYHLTINPTLDCNLKCWYCSVDYAGTKHNKEKMSDETVAALNNHLQSLAIQQKANSISLDWFGGEPMLYYDEVVSKVSSFAKKITSEHNVFFRQQMTTNATLFNEDRIRQMKDWEFNSFQIPMDGNEKRHNQIKFYKDKQGTYRKIVDNINLLTEIIPNVHLIVRVNYDKQTLKDIKDILPDFTEKSRKIMLVDFQRVWQVECTDKERELLKEAKEYFRQEGIRSEFWAYRPNRYHCCYADNYHYYAVNYNGKVFKCTARDYDDDKVIGHLQTSGKIEWNDELLSKYFDKAPFENEVCESCIKLPLCMGPCIQKGYELRKRNEKYSCVYNNVEYSLNDYIIEQAKKRNLIQ